MFTIIFDPVAFTFFAFEIRWYSLSYIFGILLTISYGYSERISYLDISKNLLWIVSLVYITYISDLAVYSYFK